MFLSITASRLLLISVKPFATIVGVSTITCISTNPQRKQKCGILVQRFVFSEGRYVSGDQVGTLGCDTYQCSCVVSSERLMIEGTVYPVEAVPTLSRLMKLYPPSWSPSAKLYAAFQCILDYLGLWLRNKAPSMSGTPNVSFPRSPLSCLS